MEIAVHDNTLRDGTGKIVAIYNATEDVTRDRTGRIVGKGNQMLRAFGQRERREGKTPPGFVAGGVLLTGNSVPPAREPPVGNYY
jgi:hypothetical protein